MLKKLPVFFTLVLCTLFTLGLSSCDFFEEPDKVKIFTVTFNANDGSKNPAVASQSFTEGIAKKFLTIKKLGFKKQGYNFTGWSLTPEAASGKIDFSDGETYTAVSDITLYAVWTLKKTYNVTFNANDGSENPEVAVQTFTEGLKHNLKTTAQLGFFKPDFYIAGWSLTPDSDSDKPDFSDGESYTAVSDITLYAVWKPVTLKTGNSIMNIFKYSLNASDATSFAAADKAPDNCQYYLDPTEKIPVWYDGSTKTIYYCLNGNTRLLLNPDSRILFYDMSSLLEIQTSDFDTSNVTDMNSMFCGCTNLTSLDLSVFDTSKVNDMAGMFAKCKNLPALDVSAFDTSNVTKMNSMFDRCTNLTTLDLSTFDTSNVTNMGDMFYGCESLTSLDLSTFDTSNVTNMGDMFYGCENLTTLNLSSFDTSNVTKMNSMFSNCISLTSLDLSSFDTSNVTDMIQMFSECTSLTSLNLSSFDTSNVTDMDLMFYECENLTTLNLSNFNTSNVTDMDWMFCGCNNLTSLDVSAFNTSNVTDMSLMFKGCTNLTSLDLSTFDTSNVTDMDWMFCECTNLETIYTADKTDWNRETVSSSADMFLGCSKLYEEPYSGEDIIYAHTGTVNGINGFFTVKE